LDDSWYPFVDVCAVVPPSRRGDVRAHRPGRWSGIFVDSVEPSAADAGCRAVSGRPAWFRGPQGRHLGDRDASHPHPRDATAPPRSPRGRTARPSAAFSANSGSSYPPRQQKALTAGASSSRRSYHDAGALRRLARAGVHSHCALQRERLLRRREPGASGCAAFYPPLSKSVRARERINSYQRLRLAPGTAGATGAFAALSPTSVILWPGVSVGKLQACGVPPLLCRDEVIAAYKTQKPSGPHRDSGRCRF